MSTYDLDDEFVRRFIEQDWRHPDAILMAGHLEKQLPPVEPDREYLVKDGRDKFWRWDVRQSAWCCIQTRDTYAQWDALVLGHGPVTIYRTVE